MANSYIILDTNIFIDHLRKVNKENSFLTYLANNYTFSTTSITIYELFAGCVSKQHNKDVEKILHGVKILDFDNQAARICSTERLRLLKQNKQFEIRDIFIAGVVLRNNLPLATLNVKHFNNFAGIQTVNLYNH